MNTSALRIQVILYLLAVLFPIAIYLAGLISKDTREDAYVLQQIGWVDGTISAWEERSFQGVTPQRIQQVDGVLERIAANFVNLPKNHIESNLHDVEVSYFSLVRLWQKIKGLEGVPTPAMMQDTHQSLKRLSLAVETISKAKQERALYGLYGILVVALLLSFSLLWYVQRYLKVQDRRHAFIDNVTGLYNRFYFLEAIETSVSLAKRHQDPMTLIFFGMDDFEQYPLRDRDALIKGFGALLLPLTRSSDICCRVGENEYAIIAPKTETAKAQILAERIRKAVANDLKVQSEAVTVSMGIVAHREKEGTEALVIRGEKRMYEAKRYRNRILAE